MPVKRRVEKRRVDPEAFYEIWAGVLDGGYDFFGDLPGIGVETDEYGRPNLESAAAAWQVLGERICAERNADLGPLWGEEKFGRPWEAPDAA